MAKFGIGPSEDMSDKFMKNSNRKGNKKTLFKKKSKTKKKKSLFGKRDKDDDGDHEYR